MYYINSLCQKRSGYAHEQEEDQKMKYTQRQWDRTVGWGTVPDEYNSELSTDDTDGQDSKRSKTDREKVLQTTSEWKKLYETDDRCKSR